MKLQYFFPEIAFSGIVPFPCIRTSVTGQRRLWVTMRLGFKKAKVITSCISTVCFLFLHIITYSTKLKLVHISRGLLSESNMMYQLSLMLPLLSQFLFYHSCFTSLCQKVLPDLTGGFRESSCKSSNQEGNFNGVDEVKWKTFA